MKKKIAILTQPLNVNYGGILQNFALQQVLRNLGHSPVTINRWNNLSLPWLRKAIYYFKIHNIFYRHNFRFLNEYVNLTEKLDSNNKFYLHFTQNKYDAYIVGSDQTWRPEYSPNIDNYFLDFLDKSSPAKKIAYATSFGTSAWEFSEKQEERARELVRKFDAVGVREDSAIQLCEQHLSVDAKLVLDPTMLLTAEDYRKTYNNKNFPKRSGIFVYVLDHNIDKEEIIQKISANRNQEIFRNQPLASYHKGKLSAKDKIYPPIKTWLKAFDDADFIITDSFHGTVFSILYNKPFIAVANLKRGAARFTSILSKLGLESRLVYNINDLNPTLLSEELDYKMINSKLEALREDSINFLKENL